MYAVTGANGQLGRLAIEALLETVAPGDIVAAVRRPEAAADLTALGVQVREADYNRPETLRAAFAGVDRVLLISSSEVGQRTAQHREVIAAAKAAGVKLIAYTSILHADRSPIKLAQEHQETEAALAASGVPTVLLRNGWYTENYLQAVKPALANGATMGAARDGRISLAARADYAAAAAKALTSEGQAGRIYELAGDDAWTLSDLAAEITRQSGRPVAYHDLPEAAYKDALIGHGLPPQVAALVADADARAADGALFEDGRALSGLIGRATTPVPATVAAALKS